MMGGAAGGLDGLCHLTPHTRYYLTLYQTVMHF